MGHFDNLLKIKEIKKKMDNSDYTSALKILETMDLKKIKNTGDIGLIAEVYTQNSNYEEAMDWLLKIYHKIKTRKVIYQLIWLSLKMRNISDAQHYLEEYEKIAPKDCDKYIFRYKIDKLKGEEPETLIETLKTLKDYEYMEQWAYELAKLYYKTGLEEECIKECSDIILWFGEGTYVEKAKVLKSYFSGDTDKNKLIEDLKRRSQIVHTNDMEKIS